MYVGTTEAAQILGIETSRLRYLLSQNRVKGAYKSGKFWIIPLYNRMPIISRGKRGPKPKWCRRIPAKNTINVNRNNIAANKNKNQDDWEPVISVKRYNSNTQGFFVKINGPCEIIYRPKKPLDCGAALWIETFASIQVQLEKSDKNKKKQSKTVLVPIA
ncbi:MAG: helix-turn-helix domain-containing protein [Rivularia sp. ALOHA_DT_140]|nr:helix-turn-helix domain-containing protein [Rivularia sp. ALOHA_DT_140]